MSTITKNAAIFILTLFLFSACRPAEKDACGGGVNSLHQALCAYMSAYPESQLRDVYKFCFQDFFGLEHILADSASAANYIETEIQLADSSDWQRSRFCYPLLDSNYYRLDLGYVYDGTISVASMAHAMMESSRRQPTTDSLRFKEWCIRWQTIVDVLEDVQPRPLCFELDKGIIDSLLACGQYAFHHSRHFNNSYHQHYRIIHRDVYEQLIERELQADNRTL